MLALVAFAANSIFCRMALLDSAIDPISFSAIRLLSGVLTLFLLLSLLPRKKASLQTKGQWKASAMLFIYIIGFSFAYQYLDTGTGALILFSAVQFTILGVNLARGERFTVREWVGIALACSGFVYLMLPGASKPDMIGFVLMSAAGLAWGAYTLAGRRSTSALSDTAWNFCRSLTFLILFIPTYFIVSIYISPNSSPADKIYFQLSTTGIILALASGSIASGLGYALWYSVLPKLSSSVSALSQLSVPIIASMGGVVLAGEALSLRLIIAGLFILGGIALVISVKK